MPDIVPEKTYTFFMPQEERIFFRHFYVITIALLLVVFFLRIYISAATAGDAMVFALCIVLPMYLLRLVYGKRFVESVTLDFHARTAHFLFSDERGLMKRNFQEIKEIKFRFYLTFVLDDLRVMVKRPRNKKEVFRVLHGVSKVDVGIFKGN
jgi:hypothetical protein